MNRDLVVKALEAEGVPAFGAFYEPVYNVGFFRSLATARRSTMPQLRGKVDYRKYPGTCPVSERVAYHRTIWVLHRMLLGTQSQTAEMCDAFEKVMENIDELRK